MFWESRPPHSSSRPSGRAAAVAYILCTPQIIPKCHLVVEIEIFIRLQRKLEFIYTGKLAKSI